ncbi:MAG TPA: response regulator transcription factor [Candidatus Nanopelagicaceae bacterium]|nr:response regulator transcription factor [Candidatus Nanopelagicaceae bacterium]
MPTADNDPALVLIVDDEDSVADLLVDALNLGGYRSLRAKDGMDALRIMRDESPDLLLLDVNMPLMDGFELLERIRSKGDQTPALFLTARQDRQDTTRGFVLGADDYITKPFGLEELLLRVAAVLRRTRKAEDPTDVLRCGPVELHVLNHEVFVDSAPVTLSPTEFRLLEYLIQNQRRVLTKSQLLSSVWDIDFEAETSVVDTYISYLRKKIDPEGTGLIRTVRGVGFQLRDPRANKTGPAKSKA